MKKNSIKVNVKFAYPSDENLSYLYSLRATIHYSIPSVFGFTKSKVIYSTIIEETSVEKFLEEAQRLIVTGEIKTIIRGLVEKDIMKRLVEQHENQEDKIRNILNTLNQMKFDFTMDIPQAEQTAVNAKEVAFGEPQALKIVPRDKPSGVLPRTFKYQSDGNDLSDLFD